MKATSRLLAPVLLAFAFAGCGRLLFEEVRDRDVRDADLDATNDAALDAASDGALDAMSDAASDGALDAMSDAASDADLDATSDGALDATNDGQVAPCTWGAFGAPEEIIGLNLTGDLWGPSLSVDGRTLYFSRVEGGDEQVMVATRPDLGPSFSPGVAVPNVNSPGEEGTPFISRDGLTLYFFSTRPGGVGDRDVWFMTRSSVSDPLMNARVLSGVGSSEFDQLPRVSEDGLTLWLSSSRSGSAGACDIWVATRASTAVDFGTPSNTTELNSGDFDAAPTFSADGLFVVFASDRPGGQGQLDLWTATRPSISEPWGSFQNLSVANNSMNDADPMLSPDESELFYSSDRDGTRKLWRVTRQCL